MSSSAYPDTEIFSFERNPLYLRIGAGTGIFTRALLANPEWTTALGELKAVEPSEGMRNQFSKTVNDVRASVAHGTFDSTNVPDGWADVIIIAQVFVLACCGNNLKWSEILDRV